LFAYRKQWKGAGLVLLGAYGATGIDGLAHYALALCSEHSLATNLTILLEADTGLSLLLASAASIRRTGLKVASR
jgi:hypothetical protein